MWDRHGYVEAAADLFMVMAPKGFARFMTADFCFKMQVQLGY
jgi:hypothetical protein